MKNNEEELKMILLGESGVGKTAIIKRYLYDQFNLEHNPSAAMNYVEKQITIKNKNIRLNIWDTIGQEKYRSLSKLFLKETQIVILVYSIIDKKSFEELSYWNQLFKEQIGDNCLLGVVGNKCDLLLDQAVTEEQGREYAKNNNAIFALLSAKENKVGIDDYIEQLVKEYLNRRNNNIRIEDFEIIENRKKGIVLSKKKMKDYGYNDEGCCSGKAKARKKKYDDILKNNKGVIDSIFLGADGVGKTSLIKRIMGQNFNENEKHTEELNNYETDYTNSTMQLTLNIYDMCNDEKRNKSTQNAIKKSQIYFLVYDVNDMNTLKEIEFMLKVIKKIQKEDKDKNNVVLVMIANKKDLNSDQKLIINDFEDIGGAEKGETLANENDALFFKITARDDKEIKDIIGIAIEKYINLP